jgi:hypothetical protein
MPQNDRRDYGSRITSRGSTTSKSRERPLTVDRLAEIDLASAEVLRTFETGADQIYGATTPVTISLSATRRARAISGRPSLR